MSATEVKKRGRPKGRPAKAKGGEAKGASPARGGPTLIKKYANRRLYDTKRSKHVTLEDLMEVLARGEDIQVVDASTGEDVTKRVMTQIILQEEENRHFSLLPLDFLKKLIQYRDDSVREYFQRFLSTSLDMYLQAQRTVGQRMEGFTGNLASGMPPMMPGMMPTMDPARMASMFPWFGAMNPMGYPMPGTPPPPPPAAPPPPSEPARDDDSVPDDIAELKRRLAELEQRYPRRK